MAKNAYVAGAAHPTPCRLCLLNFCIQLKEIKMLLIKSNKDFTFRYLFSGHPANANT